MIKSMFQDMKVKMEESKTMSQDKVTLMAKYFAKYSLMINQIDLAQIVDAGFVESASKWTVNDVIPGFLDFAKEESEGIKIAEIRAYLQVAFSHVDHLFTRLLASAQADAREKIFVEAICQKFISL